MVATASTRSSSRGSDRRDDRGVLFPSALAFATVLALALAGLTLVFTRADAPDRVAIRQVATPVQPSPSARESLPPAIVLPPDVERGLVRVDIFNNSSVTGLAERAAKRAHRLGWRVHGTDNWVGSVPTSTVYYPRGRRLEASVLADDLGVRRFRRAVAPMRADRLTVILTQTRTGN